MSEDPFMDTIEENCELPDGWGVQNLSGFTFEVSDHESDGLADAVIEVINGKGTTELVLSHTDMPGRLEAVSVSSGEEPGEYSDIPSTIGVLQYDEPSSEAAVKAIDKLTDDSVLSDLAQERDFVEN